MRSRNLGHGFSLYFVWPVRHAMRETALKIIQVDATARLISRTGALVDVSLVRQKAADSSLSRETMESTESY